jgi:hypothetical protein
MPSRTANAHANVSKDDGRISVQEAGIARFDMADDKVIGDGGNVTVYERPDGSQYALDRRGVGKEWDQTSTMFGRARFDAREHATGRWPDSRSIEVAEPAAAEANPQRARRRGSRFRTG